jgi:hypothetical protein
MENGPRTTRRTFVAGAGAVGVLALLPAPTLARLRATGPRPGGAGRFLTAHELDTLRALTARLVPGPPDDPDPGALEAGAAEAIDLLLGAFTLDPPVIHAGGPFSDRAGARHDDFADFVALDAHAELGWRIRIEGSQGKPEREFAGPVKGLQRTYRDGLALLDARAGGEFAALPGLARDVIVDDVLDTDVQGFVATAFGHTLEAMYGPPEYGGNRDAAGWRYTGWDGDTQPRGFTAQEVSGPAPAGSPRLTDATVLQRLAPLLHGLRRRGLGRR